MPISPGTRPLLRWTPRTAIVAAAAVMALLTTTTPAAAATWAAAHHPPNPPNHNRLNTVLWGVDTAGPTQAWAVGYATTGTAPIRQPMIHRWHGTRWRIVDSPRLDGGGELRSVDTLSSTLAWAVGGTLNYVGGPEIMREQHEHIIQLSRRPNVTVQVLRLAAGAHLATGGGFAVLTFREG